jgi:hypothetical protein
MRISLTFGNRSGRNDVCAESTMIEGQSKNWHGLHDSEAAEALKADLNEKLRAFEMTMDDLDGLPYAAPSL